MKNSEGMKSLFTKQKIFLQLHVLVYVKANMFNKPILKNQILALAYH